MAKRTGIVTVRNGERFRLSDVDPAATGGWKKLEGKARTEELRGRLIELQERLFAEHRRALLVVLQATDTAGKDAVLRAVLSGVSPAGVEVTSFKKPTAEELDRPFLWRVEKRLPAKAMIGVWNRSHYEDVLVVRVHGLVPEPVWKARFEQINAAEKIWAANDVTILKFFLHLSKDEQKKRLEERLAEPRKWWKFNPDDLKERARWDEYQRAYQDVIRRCSTPWAPWHVVPADREWARNLAVMETVVAKLEEMDPRHPELAFDPGSIVVR